jgi:hypothetical protein
MTEPPLQLTKPDGTPWLLERVNEKLSLRAKLPGARIFDLSTESLRRCKDLAPMDRLALAMPASWCVNNPADSRLFRSWIEPPLREVWLALIDLLQEPWVGPLDDESQSAIVAAFRAIAPSPSGVEVVSKVLALLLPDAVPLMPPLARGFLLGAAAPADGYAFVAMVDWFRRVGHDGHEALSGWAALHEEVHLSGAQVLDRLLWFDSDGHRHFAKPKPA